MTTDHYSENLGDKYKLRFKEIGHGAFGIVYKGKNNKDGTLIAAKKVRYSQDEKVKNACKKELEIFQKIKPHRNIVQLLDHIDDGDSHWFIMELGELGNLEEYLQKFDLVFTDKLKIMFDCARAIYHLHTQNPAIVHRDIKPANVLMQMDGHEIIAKISDFGVSKKCSTNQEFFQLEMKTRCGTPSFMAPEWFDNNADLSPSTDIFSLGLLFQVLYLYDEGNRELYPLSVESRRSNKLYHYGLEKKHAKEKDNPMPCLFSPCDSDPFYAIRLQNTITSMTEYEAAKRMNIQTVEKTLQSILFSGTGVRQLINVVEIQEGQSRKLKAKINHETLQYLQSKLSSDDRKVVVVSMIGLYRTGKSSLLNMWAGLGTQGFDWKDGEDACTSGVWVFCLQHRDKDIILLDCQGTDDAHCSDLEIDVWISLFSMLTSSVLVFNKLHNIDQSVFHILHSIHAHAILHLEKPEKFNYPELCLVIRDFLLGKVTHTNDDATLERHFKDNKDMTQEKDAIKENFHKRKCFKLVLPSMQPWSVKEWSFGNDEISQEFQDGARQIWNYITQEASCFSIGEKAVTTKEWAKRIGDIASCLDYAVSDLKAQGEKVSIYMSTKDIQRQLLRRLEEHLVRKVKFFKDTFEEPITDIQTCMLDEEHVKKQVDQLCEEVIKRMQQYTNGIDTVQLDKIKKFTTEVKANMKTVYSCLQKIFVALFSVRNSKNFCLLMQMYFPQLSENAHTKVAEFMSRKVICNSEEPDLSFVQTPKLYICSELISIIANMKANIKCILKDDTVLENFLKDNTDAGAIIDDIMECFRSFFFGKDLSGLPRMLAAIDNSNEWTPWMKNMIIYNLQNSIKMFTEQQFPVAARVLNEMYQEGEDKRKDLLEIMSTHHGSLQDLLRKYFTASILSSNAKAILEETIERLEIDYSNQSVRDDSFVSHIILHMAFAPQHFVQHLKEMYAKVDMAYYFKCQHEMSGKFISHLSKLFHNAKEYVCWSLHKDYKKFHCDHEEYVEYIKHYLRSNFLPIQKFEPVMKLMHYRLLEDFCKKIQKP